MISVYNTFYPGWIPHIAGSVVITSIGLFLVFIAFSIVSFYYMRKKRNARKTISSSAPTNPSLVIQNDAILRSIHALNGKATCILFAGSSVRDLPVTIPVKIAVEISKTHKCLLIDLDINRNAVAHVFDLDCDTINHDLTIRSLATDFENLYVWPAKNFQLLRQMNVKQLIENASGKYDRILVYAPYLMTLPDRRPIASACKYAFLFKGKQDTSLKRLLNFCSCKVIQEV